METDFATADALMASALRHRAGALLDRRPVPAADDGGASASAGDRGGAPGPAAARRTSQADAPGGAARSGGADGYGSSGSGSGGPGSGGPGSAGGSDSGAGTPGSAGARPAPLRSGSAVPAAAEGAPPSRGASSPRTGRRPAWREALLERLPVWVQVRCGLEPRTVAAIAVTLAAVLAFAVHHFWTGRPRTVQLPPPVRTAGSPSASAAPSAAPQPSASTIAVDVAGRVRRPGVLRLPAGSRVTDALQAAGGALPGTDTDGLNLARVLADGEQVLVGRPAEDQAAPGAPGTVQGSGSGSGSVAGAAPAGPVSLSTATIDQLDALPGVGPVLARHIVEFRTRHGGFASLDQLHQVLGVGRRRFEDLKRLVRP